MWKTYGVAKLGAEIICPLIRGLICVIQIIPKVHWRFAENLWRGLCFDQIRLMVQREGDHMGMRIAGGAPSAPVASQSSVAQWQLRLLQAQAQPPAAPATPKPTETLGNNVNTFA
jgi:hypothetical protein